MVRKLHQALAFGMDPSPRVCEPLPSADWEKPPGRHLPVRPVKPLLALVLAVFAGEIVSPMRVGAGEAGSSPRVALVNNSGREGIGGLVAAQLQAVGIAVSTVSEGDNVEPNTTLRFHPSSWTMANEIVRALPGRIYLKAAERTDPNEMVLILGADLELRFRPVVQGAVQADPDPRSEASAEIQELKQDLHDIREQTEAQREQIEALRRQLDAAAESGTRSSDSSKKPTGADARVTPPARAPSWNWSVALSALNPSGRLGNTFGQTYGGMLAARYTLADRLGVELTTGGWLGRVRFAEPQGGGEATSTLRILPLLGLVLVQTRSGRVASQFGLGPAVGHISVSKMEAMGGDLSGPEAAVGLGYAAKGSFAYNLGQVAATFDLAWLGMEATLGGGREGSGIFASLGVGF